MNGVDHTPRVLVVEDEAIIALDIEQTLKRADFDVVACLSVQAALDEIDAHAFDCAVVDLNLQGVLARDVVKALERRGIRFIVVSGCEKSAVSASRCRTHFLEKPFDRAKLLRAVAETTGWGGSRRVIQIRS